VMLTLVVLLTPATRSELQRLQGRITFWQLGHT